MPVSDDSALNYLAAGAEKSTTKQHWVVAWVTAVDAAIVAAAEHLSFSSWLRVSAVIVLAALAARADASECDATWGEDSGIPMRRVTYVGPLRWSLALAAARLSGARLVAAETSSCDLPNGASMFVVRYFDMGSYTSGSPSCSAAGELVACSLSGWLYVPSGAGPFPAIVLIHSSANPRAESDYCNITEYFVRKGYVVFQPLRRGYSGDAGLGSNSGELPDTTLDNLAAGQPTRSPIAPLLLSICDHDGIAGLTTSERDCVNTELQWSQGASELRKAIEFIGGLDQVDPGRIALLGHAGGANIAAMSGAFSTLPGAALRGVRAAVLLSPGERSWGCDHAYLGDRLTQSVKSRAFPLAILQPGNGDSVEPTQDLANAAVTTKDYQFMAALLPEVDGTAAEVQERFATQAKHVDRWAPIAWRFFDIYLVK